MNFLIKKMYYKNSNHKTKKLVDIITRGDVMAQLVSLVTEEPSLELDERERYRRPNIACEVLTTDIPVLNERLSQKALLSKLYAFLETEPPLNPLLASFFSRTLSMLICRKADQNWYSYQFTCLQVLDFFKSRDNSLELLLKHLGTSAIMDLTLKLITQVEGTEMQQNILNWLENEGLVENLISLFLPTVDADRHYNAAQLLCDTIRKLRENITTCNDRRGDPILDAIQSPEMIGKMLNHMFEGELKESSIVGGISVLLSLLEFSPSDSGERLYNQNENNPDELMETVPTALKSVVSAISPYLPKLHDLLINPPTKDPVMLACGIIDPPLGNTRLSVIKLFAALIATNTSEVNVVLDQLSTMQVLLDLFFHYSWNNFLHTQVDKCLDFALYATICNCETNLISNIFIKCRLLQRILGAWEDNETEQNKGGKRRGYMGHLTNIANTVVKYSKYSAGSLKEFLNENIDPDTMIAWQQYVETALTPINEIHQKCLGGKHPAHNTPKDGEGDFKEIRFPDDAALQQNFVDYQQKASDYAQNYVFANFDTNDHINAQEDSELKAREQIFEDMCTSLNQIGPDMFNVGPNMDEENWIELPNSDWNTLDDIASNSSDEEDKGNSEDGFVDADLWSSVGVGAPVVDPGNPWLKTESIITQGSDENEGWANFVNDINIEQLQAIQLTSEPTTSLFQTAIGENASVNLVETNEEDTSKTDAIALPLKEDIEKSDNNANLNTLTVQEDTIPDDELIDNFRFLSKQGMIAENTESQSQDQKEEAKDVLPETSISESAVISNETAERKNEAVGEPV